MSHLISLSSVHRCKVKQQNDLNEKMQTLWVVFQFILDFFFVLSLEEIAVWADLLAVSLYLTINLVFFSKRQFHY